MTENKQDNAKPTGGDCESDEAFWEDFSSYAPREDYNAVESHKGGGSHSGAPDYALGDGVDPALEFRLIYGEGKVLVRYWVREYLNNEAWCFWCGQSGGGERKFSELAQRCLTSLKFAIGEENFDIARKEAEAECESLMGERYWRIFRHGSMEEWSQVVDEGIEDLIVVRAADAHAARHLAQLAVNSLPDMTGKHLGEVLRIAADGVKSSKYLPEKCNHKWKHGQPDAALSESSLGVATCLRCGAVSFPANLSEDKRADDWEDDADDIFS
jgi:hypothetical protein